MNADGVADKVLARLNTLGICCLSGRLRTIVQIRGVNVVPPSGIETIDQGLHGGDGFRRGEGTVSGAVDKGASQEFAVAHFIDDLLIGAFVLHHHQSIALGMQRQNGNVKLSVEDDILFQIANRLGVGTDARGILQRFQIGVEIQSCLLVKRHYLSASNGTIQLVAIINSGIPGDVALRAEFQLPAKGKDEGKVHTC